MPTPWTRALVTGASSGIGRELSRQLAGDGTHLVVVARDEGRLQELADELRSAHGGEVEVLPADLADPAERKAVEDRLAAEPVIDLLVNNAGFGTHGAFADCDPDREEQLILVNALAPLRLARAALPGMVQRRRGWVLNVSSMAGLQPSPGNATYAATKAFLTSLSESIHEELRASGVQVTAVLPGFTRTEFQQRAGIEGRDIPGFAWQSVEGCAAEALAGARAGKAWVVTGRLNRVVAAAAGVAPRGIRRRVAARVTSRL
jgi:uncharacterized protein